MRNTYLFVKILFDFNSLSNFLNFSRQSAVYPALMCENLVFFSIVMSYFFLEKSYHNHWANFGFSNFSYKFLNPNNFFQLEFYIIVIIYQIWETSRNKLKSILLPKLFWPFTVWINCSRDLKNFANSRPSALNFKSFSQSLEQFFLTVDQNKFGSKIPLVQHSLNVFL